MYIQFNIILINTVNIKFPKIRIGLLIRYNKSSAEVAEINKYFHKSCSLLIILRDNYPGQFHEVL
jgi:hypothetical protein